MLPSDDRILRIFAVENRHVWNIWDTLPHYL